MSNKASDKRKYLGIDAGGTFTDFVLIDRSGWRIHKVLSTPDDPSRAILQGLTEMDLITDLESLFIVHGSTVATNAALERKEAKTVYVANLGFGDILSIGRQNRQELYNLKPAPASVPVPKALCVEVDCRRDASGNVVQALTQAEVKRVVRQVQSLAPEAVAINLLFSFLNSDDEERLEKALETVCPVSRSSFVLPIYKEYERGIATWLNASLAPRIHHYMQALISSLPGASISIIQSSGGTIAIDQAARRAANLLLSGPAGGLSAVKTLAESLKVRQIISFDMGGTSTDVALMDDDFKLTDEGRIAGWPVAIPMLEMDTIGAGGGSIAWLDEGGLLHVGPQSAGAYPGPACYGKGGEAPTVTDANVVLGRLRPEAFLGGDMSLSPELSQAALETLSSQMGITTLELAEGIITLAEQQMVNALREISVQKGHDPKQFLLCCFGGAGGMHVCSLAEKMSVSRAIVPVHSGVLSAYGMLSAPKRRELKQSKIGLWSAMSPQEIESTFVTLERQARQELIEEGVPASSIHFQRKLEMRYSGQSFSISIPMCSDPEPLFKKKHRQLYGHSLAKAVELVNLAITAEAPPIAPYALPEIDHHSAAVKPDFVVDQPRQTDSDDDSSVPVYSRESLTPGVTIHGPAIVVEKVSTTWVKSGWTLDMDCYGNLLLSLR